jgi:hypothetical protein
MEWSPEGLGKRDDRVEQRLATLQEENRRLSEQIKRLVRTEHELYQFQGQLLLGFIAARHDGTSGRKGDCDAQMGRSARLDKEELLCH